MAWRVAKSLEQMRSQFNTLFPSRDKGSDGTIGDAAHATTNSDHNPWVKDGGMGVVTALDITHHPGEGVDTWTIAEYLRQKRDPRIKYVISNKRIFSSVSNPWQWRNYTGSNPHSKHFHVSVSSSKSHYDNTKDWDLIPKDWRPVLRKGDRGQFVRQLQILLGIVADGQFGAGVDTAVRAFQRDAGLTADGVVGTATWKALDDVAPPDPIEPSEPPPVEPPVDPDLPENRPVLRRGSKGEEVRILQQLLLIRPVDGDFGSITEVAVKAFQRGAGLDADGIVGVATWEELDKLEQIPDEKKWFENIVCTVFGGKADPNNSAYPPYSFISDDDIGCALPDRFKGDRPQVEVINEANGKRVITEIVDVGPWNVDDPYWKTNSRPQAETGRDKKGRKTNLAGLDLTPAAAKAIGLSGKGKVSWAFVSTRAEEA